MSFTNFTKPNEKFLVATCKEIIYGDRDYDGPLTPCNVNKVVEAISAVNKEIAVKRPADEDMDEFYNFWTSLVREEKKIPPAIAKAWPKGSEILLRVFLYMYQKGRKNEYDSLSAGQKGQIHAAIRYLIGLPCGFSIHCSFDEGAPEIYELDQGADKEGIALMKTNLRNLLAHLINAEGVAIVQYRTDPNGADILFGIHVIDGSLTVFSSHVIEESMQQGGTSKRHPEIYTAPDIFH